MCTNKGFVMTTAHKVVRYFYPDLKEDEIKKFGLLSIIFFLVIGTYWLLRLIKYTIFLKVAFPECLGWEPEQGRCFEPTAKKLSPWVVLFMVVIYSKLVDKVKKHQLFYIICTFYGLLFAGCATVLLIKDTYGVETVGRTALATLGWLSYFAVESFGSLVVSLFWAFTNSTTDSDSAKRGFPFIVAMAQLAAIFGSATLFFSGHIGVLWPIVFIAAFLVFMVIPVVHYFVRHTPADQLVGNTKAAATEKRKEGFIEGFVAGLTLLFSRPYLLGVLVISTFYEAVSQIVEYQMRVYSSMSPAYQGEIAFARFMSIYGMSVNIISFLVALLGTGYILKRFGPRVSLLIYPITYALTLFGLFAYFKFNPSPEALLWATFVAVVIIKGVGYAVNAPTKEMMYIPTSKDAKFKSKGWIDTFGSRFSKSSGAHVNDIFKNDLPSLMVYGSAIGFGVVGIWIMAAVYVGNKNKQLLESRQIIE